MRILFDQGVPEPLRRSLDGHVVTTAAEAGLDRLANGDLLRAAEDQYDLLVTTDQNLRYQQNVTGRPLAILVLMTTSWPTIRTHLPGVREALALVTPGSYRELDFPRPPRRTLGS